MTKLSQNQLRLCAAKARRNVLEAVYSAGSGHIGGSLSVADVLTVLYFDEMNVNVNDTSDPDRDRFVLSKGHCSPALYATLALKGYFPQQEIKKFRQADSFLQGHPSMKDVPGVDMSTGSLGQGISAACGMAIAGKLDEKCYRVYTVLGDGELEEGQVWEAAMFAAHYKLDNLCAFVDYNGMQIDGNVADVMSPLPIDQKFKAFNWNVINIDAHDIQQIQNALATAKQTKGKPTVIIAKSVKGKGVSFMENEYTWHGKAPNAQQYEQAAAELDAQIRALEEEQNG